MEWISLVTVLHNKHYLVLLLTAKGYMSKNGCRILLFPDDAMLVSVVNKRVVLQFSTGPRITDCETLL